MSGELRVALPLLSELTSSSEVVCAWLDKQGKVVREERLRLSELGAQGSKAIDLCLHPQDSLLASLELPPLPASRIGDAVSCAVDSLVLGNSEQVQRVHGPRAADGKVMVAWLERAALQRLLQLLAEVALNVRGLYPAGAFLPVAGPGVSTLSVQQGHLLVREGAQSMWLHPLAEDAIEQLGERAVQWVGEAPAGQNAAIPVMQRWSGPLPACNLLQGFKRMQRGQQGWTRALACCVLAVLVWTIGLNLYAARMAAEGQQIKAQMLSRVKQVFPELPVILNPLQQARQQRDARLAGSVAGPQQFAQLLQQAAAGMPFLAGRIEVLQFDGQALQLTLRDDARKTPTDQDWQSGLAQLGLEATQANGQWTVRRAPPVAGATGTASRSTEAVQDE